MLKKCCENCKWWERDKPWANFEKQPTNGKCNFPIQPAPEWVWNNLSEWDHEWQGENDGLSCDVFDPIPERE